MEVILKLCREKGITVILITHYMNEAAMADRVVIMDKGSIILDGTPREVFSNVETLQSTGLDVPQPTALATLLKKAGMDLKDGILTVDECAKAVTEALKGEI
jgi:energy-coupling factor transport system ATP-binding protein